MEKTVERLDDDLIDLGSVTEETKGEAILNADPGSGRLNFMLGVTAD